jgi:hypothetical protein
MENRRGGDSLLSISATNSELWPGAAHSADLASLTCLVTHPRCTLRSNSMTRPPRPGAVDSGTTPRTALIIGEDLPRGADAGTVHVPTNKAMSFLSLHVIPPAFHGTSDRQQVLETSRPTCAVAWNRHAHGERGFRDTNACGMNDVDSTTETSPPHEQSRYRHACTPGSSSEVT